MQHTQRACVVAGGDRAPMRSAAELVGQLVSEVIPDDATPDMLWHRQHELAELARTLRPLSPAREIAETLAKRLEARRGWMAAREFLR